MSRDDAIAYIKGLNPKKKAKLKEEWAAYKEEADRAEREGEKAISLEESILEGKWGDVTAGDVAPYPKLERLLKFSKEGWLDREWKDPNRAKIPRIGHRKKNLLVPGENKRVLI